MSVTQARLMAIVRIVVGALFLLRTTPLAWLVLPWVRLPFLGWPEPGWKASAMGWLLPASLCIAACLVRTIAAIAFTIGFRGRMAGMVVAASGYPLLLNDAMAYTNTLHLIHLAVLVVALADSSVDFAVRREVAISPMSGVWLVRALPISVYLFSAVAKLNAQWLDGKTLPRLVDQGDVAIPSFVRAHPRSASIAMALLELALPVLLVIPRTRKIALFLGAAFHFGLQLSVHPDVFGLVMIALLIAFVDQKQSPSHAASAG